MSRFIKQLHNRHGFTLVELIVVLAILLLVLSLAYSLLFYGTTGFRTGTRKANLQQTARVIETTLQNQLRNALALTLTDQVPDGAENYLTITDQALYQSGHAVSSPVVEELSIRLQGEGEAVRLEYVLRLTETNQVFEYTSQILLNNLTWSDYSEVGTGYFSLNTWVLVYEPIP